MSQGQDWKLGSITRLGNLGAIHTEDFLAHPGFSTRTGFLKTPPIGPGVEQIVTITGSFGAYTEKNVHYDIQKKYSTIVGNRFDKRVSQTSKENSELDVIEASTTLYKKSVTSQVYVGQHLTQKESREIAIGKQTIAQFGNRTLTVYGDDARVYGGDRTIRTEGAIISKYFGPEIAVSRRGKDVSVLNGMHLDAFAGPRLEYVDLAQYNFNLGLTVIVHHIFRGIQLWGAAWGPLVLENNLLKSGMAGLNAAIGLARYRIGAFSARAGLPFGIWRIPKP